MGVTKLKLPPPQQVRPWHISIHGPRGVYKGKEGATGGCAFIRMPLPGIVWKEKNLAWIGWDRNYDESLWAV